MIRRERTPIRFVAALALALALSPAAAGAQYLDPGAGSILVQVVIAVVVGASVGIRLYWGKIAAFLSRRSKDNPPR